MCIPMDVFAFTSHPSPRRQHKGSGVMGIKKKLRARHASKTENTWNILVFSILAVDARGFEAGEETCIHSGSK